MARNLQNATDCYTGGAAGFHPSGLPGRLGGDAEQPRQRVAEPSHGRPWRGTSKRHRLPQAALEVHTRADFPAEWAMTQNNLAITLADLADQPRQDRCGLLQRAIVCGKGALTVCTPDAFPNEHAEMLKNLNIHRRAYEAGGCMEKVAFDDIPPAG